MDLGLLIVRFVVGLTLAAHGAQKLFGWFGGYGLDGTGQFMETLGFHPGRRHAALAGLTEAGGGVLLALGLLTPLGAALIASVMLVATITVHLKKGFFAASGGYEYNLVLAAAAVSLAFSGPGALSLDALLGYSFAGTLWGVGAMIVAIVSALVQLAQRHSSAEAGDVSSAA
ncbi:MAG TPA: DoxX family protein [Galbitalea sp.]|jgi:putative oxidoreductase